VVLVLAMLEYQRQVELLALQAQVVEVVAVVILRLGLAVQAAQA
jgi:hypothetical protein